MFAMTEKNAMEYSEKANGMLKYRLYVQTGSGAHPASCTMDTGGPFPGGKARPGCDADHSPPSSAEVKNE
jgi:hypothetical protein